MRIDLNCDLGESYGIYHLGQDEDVMGSITSANVACGFHGGDPMVIRRTIRLAREANVAVGAHPSFADLLGFGRREMHVPADEVEDLVLFQIAAVAGVAKAEGVGLQHVKAHGALNNMASREPALARAIARAVAAFDRSLALIALAGSCVMEAGRAEGLRVVSEVYADRAYEPDGSLVSRRKPGSVIHEPDDVVRRVVRMATDGTVAASDGSTLRLDAESVCVHGDTPGAAELTRRIREELERAGVRVMALGSA